MKKILIKFNLAVMLAWMLNPVIPYANAAPGNITPPDPEDADAKINELDKLIRKAYVISEELWKKEGIEIVDGLPTRSVFVQAAEAAVAAPSEAAAANSPQKKELVLEEPDTEKKPEPEEPTFDKLEKPEFSIEGESDEPAGIRGVLRKRQEEVAKEEKKKQGEYSNPLYWEHVRDEYRKKREEKKKEEEEQAKLEEDELAAERKKKWMIPQKRPDESYKTMRLPSAIGKKVYSKENKHLPQVVYEEEYKKILFESAAAGNLDAMRAMVQWFNTTEVRDQDGNTPLLYASMAGNENAVIALLGMDAAVNVKNNNGVTPLSAATKISRPDIATALLRKGAYNEGNVNDETPLMLAAKNNDVRIANAIIKKGANLDSRMKNGDTALHIASQYNSPEIAYLLVKKGANTEIRNFQGYTPLMLSAASGNEEITNILLKVGADTNKKDTLGRTPSKLASDKGFISVAELIESEDVRRQLVVEKLTRMRLEDRYQQPEAIEASTGSITPGVPLPKRKPLRDKSGKVPAPFFSKEEKNKM